MDEPLAALVAKRDEVAEQIRVGQQRVQELVGNLDALEAAIRIFDPTQCLSPRAVAPQNLAKAGAMTRAILSVLDRKTAPVATEEVTKCVMMEQGMDITDARAVFLMDRRVRASLRTMSGRKVVRCVEFHKGKQSIWEIVRA